MGRECPRCGYVRQDSDPGAPEECPRCGVIYAKGRAPESPRPASPAPRAQAEQSSAPAGDRPGEVTGAGGEGLAVPESSGEPEGQLVGPPRKGVLLFTSVGLILFVIIVRLMVGTMHPGVLVPVMAFSLVIGLIVASVRHKALAAGLVLLVLVAGIMLDKRGDASRLEEFNGVVKWGKRSAKICDGHWQGGQRHQRFSLRNRALVWRPPQMLTSTRIVRQPSSPDDSFTLLTVTEGSEVVGKYKLDPNSPFEQGTAATRYYLQICVSEWPEQQVTAVHRIYGPPPPKSITIGYDPDAPVVDRTVSFDEFRKWLEEQI